MHFVHRTLCAVTLIQTKLTWIFSIRVRELFEPIVLLEKGDRFLLLFLKAFSWETDLWIPVGDFAIKTQNLEGKSVLTKDRLGKNKMWSSTENHNYLCHPCTRTCRFGLQQKVGI